MASLPAEEIDGATDERAGMSPLPTLTPAAWRAWVAEGARGELRPLADRRPRRMRRGQARDE